jgi:hypothetical protein
MRLKTPKIVIFPGWRSVGVEGTLCTLSSPAPRKTRSVKVPPVSRPRRILKESFLFSVFGFRFSVFGFSVRETRRVALLYIFNGLATNLLFLSSPALPFNKLLLYLQLS